MKVPNHWTTGKFPKLSILQGPVQWHMGSRVARSHHLCLVRDLSITLKGNSILMGAPSQTPPRLGSGHQSAVRL